MFETMHVLRVNQIGTKERYQREQRKQGRGGGWTLQLWDTILGLGICARTQRRETVWDLRKANCRCRGGYQKEDGVFKFCLSSCTPNKDHFGSIPLEGFAVVVLIGFPQRSIRFKNVWKLGGLKQQAEEESFGRY